MPNYDLSSANSGRVANQTVDMLRIANQTVWSASTPDGPYYLNDAVGVTLPGFSDGTPNIVTGHLCMFHNDGFFTGFQWFDADAAAGSWVLSLYEATTSDGHLPNSGDTKLDNITVASDGSGWRISNFDDPVPIDLTKMYCLTRYSSTGH